MDVYGILLLTLFFIWIMIGAFGLLLACLQGSENEDDVFIEERV